MKKATWAAGGLVVVALGTYLIAGNMQKEETALPSVDHINVKQLVEDLGSGKVPAQSASIDARTLTVVGNDGQTADYDLPEDAFFLSIAPYVEQTHPCEIHSLTGCQGEMKNEDFLVTILDSEGNTLMKDSSLKTASNGFVDIWLPRDRSFLVKMVHDGKVAEAQISTYDQDNTCITTMQLS